MTMDENLRRLMALNDLKRSYLDNGAFPMGLSTVLPGLDMFEIMGIVSDLKPPIIEVNPINVSRDRTGDYDEI